VTCYSVYVETDDSGRWMAHVPALPGCVVSGESAERAVEVMPAAIRDYCAWLDGHGVTVPPEDEAVEVTVDGSISGIGPFSPGDAAAIFPPDEVPLTPESMEHYLRLMAFSRADLMVLIRDLPDALLDWQLDADSLSLRRLLRHVGNAEEWYVSRIVQPDTLPSEWRHDKDMPIMRFLEMERRTAVERLRELTEAERTDVIRTGRWTEHPDEPWTARKVLRRLVEHEREHTAQAREILLGWWEREGRRAETGSKEGLMAALTAAREELLIAVARMRPEERGARPVCGEWTLHDLLAHIVAWEVLGAEGLRHMASGRNPDVEHVVDIDAWNRTQCEACRDKPWKELWAEFHATRVATVDALEAISVSDLNKTYPFPWGERGTAYQWVGVYVDHDWEHARELLNAR
jgi:predicted RNase H-like HicB family nuclease/uncharacterized damage-inducible protein DinB